MDFIRRWLESFTVFIKRLWLSYTLNCAIYMCEPWEGVIFNSVLVTILAMILYTGYVFVPGHVVEFSHLFRDLFLSMIGYSTNSTAALPDTDNAT